MTWEPADMEFRRVAIDDEREDSRIAALWCHPVTVESRGVVVLPPGYERRMHHYAALSYVLVKHGYATLRFDLRNHVGISDGEVADFTMSSLADDVELALRYAERERPASARYVLAPSLSARAAARAISRGAPAAGLVGLMPVVDVRHTLSRVAGEDLLLKWETKGETDPSRLYQISKNWVKAQFGQDAVERDWGGVAQTRAEIAANRCPVFAIAAEQDDWVAAQDVPLAMSEPSEWWRDCTIVEASSHDIGRNIPVMRLLLELSLERINRMSGIEEEAQVPDFTDFVEVVTTERRWAQDSYRELATPVMGGADV